MLSPLQKMFVIIAMFFSYDILAANVLWNELAFYDDYFWDGGDRKNYTWETPFFGFQAVANGQMLELTATYGNFMEYVYTVTQAQVGDVVDAEHMANPEQKFHYLVSADDETVIRDPVSISLDSSVYFAYSVAFGDLNTGGSPDPRMPSVWGWIELYATEEGELVKRFDVQSWGDSIVVGITPEPVSELLMLFGVAILALRRRRAYQSPRV